MTSGFQQQGDRGALFFEQRRQCAQQQNGASEQGPLEVPDDTPESNDE